MDSIKSFFSLLLLASLAGACSGTQNTSAQEPKNQVKVVKKQGEENDCRALKKKPNNFNTLEFSATHIAKASIEGNQLLISFQYSGCEKGTPTLVLDQTQKGKKALTVLLQLKAQGAGLCEMIVENEACFDLNTLQVPAEEWLLTINGTHELIYHPNIVR